MQQRLKYLPALIALLVAVAGLMSLAQVLTVRIHHHQFGRIDDSLLPITAEQSSRLLILCAGLLLLYLSLQILRRKLLAFQLVSAGLVLLIATEILTSRNLVQLGFYAVTLGLLWGDRRAYSVRTNNLSLQRGATMSLAVITVVFVYATIGFAHLDKREVGTSISLPSAAKYAGREIFTFQETQLHLKSRHARWFVASVNAASVLAYTLAIFSLFRPLQFQYGATRLARERARHILQQYSHDTEEFFKLWPPDKHFYFSEAGNSFIAYKVVGSDALVLGGPAGDSTEFANLTKDFGTFARIGGWTVTYIYGNDALQQVLDENYNRLFIGNEALLNVTEFAESTANDKHFRYVRNKSVRDGLEFAYWPRPLSDEQLDQLESVSNVWLASGGRREYTFAMGYFDREYLRECDVAVLNREGQVVAYANILPILSEAPNRSIDHMRHRPGMPSTGMHYLLMQLLLLLHSEGVTGFNLGLVPLSGIEERVDTSVSERLLAVLKKVGNRYYSSEGLEQFKNKFDPSWEPRYLYYLGAPPRLLRIAGNLNKALSLPVAGRLLKRSLIALSILGAACYSSFFLAIITDPHHIFKGFISQLGAAGQNYAGLYNSFDIAGSIIMLSILRLLWWRFREEIRPYARPLTLFAIGCSGILLAALIPLPRHFMSGWIQFALHDLFSTLALAGIGLAGLWFALQRRDWWTLLLLAVFGVTLVGWSMFTIYPYGAIVQCINVLATSAWMVTLVVYLTGVIKPKVKV